MLELNKVYNCHFRDGLKLLDDNSIDLTITSPPYDKLRDYDSELLDNEDGGWNNFYLLAIELLRVTKPGGVVVWVVGDSVVNKSETGTSFEQALRFKRIGFNLHDTMIYEKAGCAFPEKTRYYQSFEYMFILSKGSPKTHNLIADKENKWGGTQTFGKSSNRQKDGSLVQRPAKRTIKMFSVRPNIWRYANGYGFNTPDRIAHNHPAIFPEELAKDHIISWSNEGDTVFDPMMGSGTVAKMAYLNKRNFIGFEISSSYCGIISQRLEKYVGDGQHVLNLPNLQTGVE